MEGASRTRLLALAVLLAVSVPLVVIAAAGGGSGDTGGSGLRVEPTPGTPLLTVYVEDPEDNRPTTNNGRRNVTIECLDGDDEVVFSRAEAWPFTDTDNGTLDPHVHLTVRPASVADAIARCRLRGTDPPLEGRKP